MKQYKIVQIEPHVFKAYYKGWFFWHCYVTYNWFETFDKRFSSLSEAEKFLAKVKYLDLQKEEKKKFKKVTRLYPPLKLPGDCD